MGRDYDALPTKIVFANDFDKDASTCYNSNALLTKDGHYCLLQDIRTVDVKDIPEFDILLAGFPCQPFSNAGNRKGVNDNNGRGTLFEECERILKGQINKGHKPKAFVFENVRGIMSSKMPDGTTVPDEIKKRMIALGYNVTSKLLCSSNYGVPQNRYRFLIVGVDTAIGEFSFDTMDAFVRDNNIPSVAENTHLPLMLGSILSNIDSIEGNEVWQYSITTQNMVENIGPCEHGSDAIRYFDGHTKLSELPPIVFEGRSWKNIPPEKLTPRFLKIYNDPKKYHAPKFFRRFAYGEINGTITASAQPENCGITHPIENRRFSVREIARIQSFPDDYSFSSIPLQSRYKVIGNAVPPIMAWVLASSLIKTIS